jgi:hypothetical protein
VIAIREAMMKSIFAGLATLALGACASSQGALLAGGPEAMLQYQRGAFASKQLPNGKRGFVFTIPANAFDGFVDPANQEKTRRDVLSGWIGEKKACPAAYQITSRTETDGTLAKMIVYEGECV